MSHLCFTPNCLGTVNSTDNVQPTIADAMLKLKDIIAKGLFTVNLFLPSGKVSVRYLYWILLLKYIINSFTQSLANRESSKEIRSSYTFVVYFLKRIDRNKYVDGHLKVWNLYIMYINRRTDFNNTYSKSVNFGNNIWTLGKKSGNLILQCVHCQL